MWIIELAFTGEPERLSARAAHRERLAARHRESVVRMAGPFADDDGALILLDVASRREVDDVIANDPYFTTAGVRVHAVRCWEPFLR